MTAPWWSKRRAIAAALSTLLIATPVAVAGEPVRLTAAFDRDARPGRATALHLGVAVDVRSRPAAVSAVRVLLPKSLGIVSSGLGLDVCRRPERDFEEVMIDGTGRSGCPANSVMAYGTVRGEVRLGTDEVIEETGTVTVLAGPIEKGTLGLVALVHGHHPFGAQLAYAGDVGPAPAPFGSALTFRVRPIPSLDGYAVVALTDLRLSVGSSKITYYDRTDSKTTAYKPDGIALPQRCPRGGFRFRAHLAFEDGSSATATRAVACRRLSRSAPTPPPAAPAP